MYRDNAKKYVESGAYGPGQGKGSDRHKGAVIGEQVGDPFLPVVKSQIKHDGRVFSHPTRAASGTAIR